MSSYYLVILFYKIIIERAISFYAVEKIVVRKDVNLKLDNHLLIDSNVSMLSFVARDVEEDVCLGQLRIFA